MDKPHGYDAEVGGYFGSLGDLVLRTLKTWVLLVMAFVLTGAWIFDSFVRSHVQGHQPMVDALLPGAGPLALATFFLAITLAYHELRVTKPNADTEIHGDQNIYNAPVINLITPPGGAPPDVRQLIETAQRTLGLTGSAPVALGPGTPDSAENYSAEAPTASVSSASVEGSDSVSTASTVGKAGTD